jgi:hypothetical protein
MNSIEQAGQEHETPEEAIDATNPAEGGAKPPRVDEYLVEKKAEDPRTTVQVTYEGIPIYEKPLFEKEGEEGDDEESGIKAQVMYEGAIPIYENRLFEKEKGGDDKEESGIKAQVMYEGAIPIYEADSSKDDEQK